MQFPLLVIITAVLFMLILVSLSSRPEILAGFMGVMILTVSAVGIILYGYGFYYSCGLSPVAVVRTLFAVFGMFLGKNEIPVLSEVPRMSSDSMQFIIYAVHLLALYATAGTVIAGISSRLLRLLNLWSIHHKDIRIIYGVNDDSIRFAEQFDRDHKAVVLFVDESSSSEYSQKILQMGSVLFNENSATDPDGKFMRRVGIRPGNQKISVYCLDDNENRNLRYAEKLMTQFEKAGIQPSQTTMVLMTDDSTAGDRMQFIPGKGTAGYGTVYAINREELTARLLILDHPPYKTVEFTDDGTAAGNFEAIIIGFGKMGQEVLRKLVMNAQFAGSSFRLTIVDEKYSRKAGNFFYIYPGLLEEYDIVIKEINARSREFYDHLDKVKDGLDYVAVCTGNEKENSEIAREISSFIRKYGENTQILQCTGKGICELKENGTVVKKDLFTPEILCIDEVDNMAKLLNHQYHIEEGNTAETDWLSCDYFSRQSCRACVDFIDAMLAAAHIEREELVDKGWPEDSVIRENLAKTEHLRWCAFHYASGYRSMKPEIMAARGDRYRKEVEETGSSSVRITKDIQNRLHACLVTWDELDELSERESVYTGRKINYKKLDWENVEMIPELMK